MSADSSIIIVFGGAGFIGHHLLKDLKRRNAADRLVSVDIRKPPFPVDGVDYQIGDVRDLSNFKIDGPVRAIYNLAAVHTTPGHPTHEYYETNIAGATEITAFARRNNINDIVFTSSISVYGPSEEKKTEASTPAPESAYGWSKHLAEKIHRAWFEENLLRRLVIVRPAVIFGPHEGGNFTRMAKLLKKGFFIYPGREDTIKACFYVQDLLDAIAYARGLEKRYVLFNGCYPDRFTIKQIVTAFRAGPFKSAREFTIPYFVVKLVALALRPFSLLGLGIHPDRVNKLVRSTDIYPQWLVEQGAAKTNRLSDVIALWEKESGGSFE